jgi:hypothetical protein
VLDLSGRKRTEAGAPGQRWRQAGSSSSLNEFVVAGL